MSGNLQWVGVRTGARGTGHFTEPAPRRVASISRNVCTFVPSSIHDVRLSVRMSPVTWKCSGMETFGRRQYSSKLTKSVINKKSRIRETLNISTDADRRTDTILKRLHDLSKKK